MWSALYSEWNFCHLWSRWQTAILYIWTGDADDDVEWESTKKKIDKQFKIMERKHGFNCNIMHESLFNDAKGMARKSDGNTFFFPRTMFLAPLENLLHSKWSGEKLFQFPTPVVKWHQSLTTFCRRSLMNTPQCVSMGRGHVWGRSDEVHFHYLFFHFHRRG